MQIFNKNSEKWDRRFLELAKLVASWSKDPSTQTGAVIARLDKSVCSVGFNGFPQKMYDWESSYNDREEKLSRIVHCEVNALLFAKEPVTGYTLYTWPFASCDRCAVIMIQAGITRFVYPELPESLRKRWEESILRTEQYFKECDVDFLAIRENGVRTVFSHGGNV